MLLLRWISKTKTRKSNEKSDKVLDECTTSGKRKATEETEEVLRYRQMPGVTLRWWWLNHKKASQKKRNGSFYYKYVIYKNVKNIFFKYLDPQKYGRDPFKFWQIFF